jgi:hypothetical protein
MLTRRRLITGLFGVGTVATAGTAAATEASGTADAGSVVEPLTKRDASQKLSVFDAMCEDWWTRRCGRDMETDHYRPSSIDFADAMRRSQARHDLLRGA